MELKKDKPVNKIFKEISHKIRGGIKAIKKRTSMVVILSVLFFLICVSLSFSLGFFSGFLALRDGHIPKIKAFLLLNIKIPGQYFKGLTARSEKISIDIKHMDFQKLEHKRKVALQTGMLISNSDDYVPAKIRYQNETVKVKLRLKGDWIDHLRGRKWSFRVKVKGDNTIDGMKVFSLHNPKTRNYIYEWIYHKLLAKEGLLALRYKFVTVILNGKQIGVYALEEHFDKRLVENNKLREGPILKFSEDLIWQERAYFGKDTDTSRLIGEVFFRSNIDGFQSNKTKENPVLKQQYIKAVTLLDKFRRHKLKTSQVFDVDKLAKYIAVSLLMGAEHGIGWANERFYYNPVTSKLEPIGFDGDAGKKIEINFVPSDIYSSLFLNDPVFTAKLIEQLNRVSKQTYLTSFFTNIQDELEKNLNIIYKDEYATFLFSKNIFFENQSLIKKILNPPRMIYAYYEQSKKRNIIFSVGNIQQLPLEIVGLLYKDIFIKPALKKNIIKGKAQLEFIAYQNISFKLPGKFKWKEEMLNDLTIKYKLLGTEKIREEKVFPIPRREEKFEKNDFIRKPANVHKFKFLKIDKSSKLINFRTGNWKLSKNLIIPKGYIVVAGPGLKLNLTNSAKILSYSPVKFIGSEEDPIKIYSSDSKGQGIVVMNAKEESVLEYVQFNNLSNLEQAGWSLTGAVNFYESPVMISNCVFKKNRSEDALNIIRTTFKIENTVFKDTQSDAFDADFAQGKFSHTSFINSGNDAIDVSGSFVEVEDVLIDGAGDKGISAGEGSQMIVKNIEIKNAEIAVSSKDNSKIDLQDSKISKSKVGFAVFQKKSEYGPGVAEVKNTEMKKIEVPYLVEKKSILLIDGKKKKSKQKKVKEILYGNEYGKSSK